MPLHAATARTTDPADRSAPRSEDSGCGGDSANNPVNRAIGSELRRVRDHLGFTRGQVVARMASDISVQTLANYEYGVRPCTISRLVEICQALEVATDVLVSLALQRGDVEPDQITLDLRALIDDQDEGYQPLRHWALNRLKNDDEAGIARVKRELLKEMAALLDVSWSDFLRYLRRFTPDHAPRRASS